ncbi:hypothetical protein F441_21661 [Phytophthora nicotianae CJ01A1]|uniref:Uncharacterized protein n=2 Tax=Phytophthora nicotianae TaxID=4792 RepID=W2QVQ3_PHYN3|nr:hypothetical protein PPTG_06486 [Phytophthora nicotianae INRA-310]ETN16320.1 hypothetical protein PPTG_06486 [Phytophthora nicotianae INRA-310]ETP01032.1 hypothetical protein F441_21661 [Phytophthora nicotianae CJ01A1]
MSMKAFRYKKIIDYNGDRLVWFIDEENKDIYRKMKANIAGGPSIMLIWCANECSWTTIENSSSNGGEDPTATGSSTCIQGLEWLSIVKASQRGIGGKHHDEREQRAQGTQERIGGLGSSLRS